MQKRYFFIILSLIIISFFLLNYNHLFYKQEKIDISKDAKENETLRGYNGLAIMLQNEEGSYDLSDADSWPASGYVFNDVLSSCENGGKLSWNEDTKSITLKTSGSDKCYVYFDIANYVNENIQLLTQKAGSMDQTAKGIFLQHTAEELNGAGDNSYRYSGNNPDNFICFGSESEAYNNGSPEAKCELKNQYRIIGIVPVTKANGSKDTLIKVIKSEYITKEELGGLASAGISMNNLYNILARVQTKDSLVGFSWNEESNKWSDGKYNYWSKEDGETQKRSTLNEALNTTFLEKLGSTWAEKVEIVQWNVGGVSAVDITPKVMKTNEESKEMGGSITSTDKIGLMYIYDYGFASAKKNWTKNLNLYDNANNQNENWLFNGVYEWPITSDSSNSSNAFNITTSGMLISYGSVSHFRGVRPVFYLKSNVKIIADKTDGSYSAPFRVQ